MQDGQVPEAYPGARLAGTVAILAQGTHRGDALCAALFLSGAKSNPYADLHRHLAH